jgi:hypothetical protein
VPGGSWTERQVALWLTPEGEQELLVGAVSQAQLAADVARVVSLPGRRRRGACTNQSYVVDGGWV